MRQKLKRFADNDQATNVVQPGKPFFENSRGNWHSFFNNSNPIVVELGCGRGEYSVGLASAFPDKNFVGCDIKGSRIWKGSSQAIEQGLSNVAFLRIHIQNLEMYFAPGEISEIWITFPDPRPRNRDERRRLTYYRFQKMYHALLKPGGLIHLKTDNLELFDYTLEVVKTIGVEDLVYTHDLYGSPFAADHKGITTRYENIYLKQGVPIKYLRYRLPAQLPALQQFEGKLADTGEVEDGASEDPATDHSPVQD